MAHPPADVPSVGCISLLQCAVRFSCDRLHRYIVLHSIAPSQLKESPTLFPPLLLSSATDAGQAVIAVLNLTWCPQSLYCVLCRQ